MTSTSVAELEDHDPYAPRLWQVWRPFTGIHRWYFAKGCPPPLRDLKGLTACVHASILLGAMGFVAAVIGLASLLGVMLWGNDDPLTSGMVLGAACGMIVVLPLSRWIGRPWWLAIGATIYSAVSFCILDLGWEFFFIESFVVTWFVMMAIVALAVSMSMVGRNIHTLLIPMAAVAGSLIATFCMTMIEWARMQGWLNDINQYEILSFMIQVQPVAAYIVLISIAMGIRLWPRMRFEDGTETFASPVD